MVLQTKDKEKGVISNSEIQSADSDGVDGGGGLVTTLTLEQVYIRVAI